MDRENQEDGSLPYRNGTVQNQETAWRCKSTVASPPGQVPPRSKMPPLPRTPPVPSDNSDRTQTSKPVGPPPRYVNIHQHYVVCHWNPAGVSERMWSVHLDASISVEYRTLGGHSCRPSQWLGVPTTRVGAPWHTTVHPGSAGDISGSTSNRCRPIWEKYHLFLGTLPVHLEMIGTTYCSTIAKTYVFGLYSHLGIYVSIKLPIYTQ